MMNSQHDSSSPSELSSRWWESVKPPSVKGRQLDNAIADFERAEKRCVSLAGSDGLRSVETAVSSIQAAAAKTVRECDGSVDATVVAAIEGLAQLAKERLVVLRAEFEEDVDDEGEPIEAELLDQKQLRALMRTLLHRSLPFAFGVGADATHFVLDEKLAPTALQTALASTVRLTRSTCGTASAQGGVLRLVIEGPRLVGLEALVKEHLDAHQPLPFADVCVLKAPRRAT